MIVDRLNFLGGLMHSLKSAMFGLYASLRASARYPD